MAASSRLFFGPFYGLSNDLWGICKKNSGPYDKNTQKTREVEKEN